MSRKLNNASYIALAGSLMLVASVSKAESAAGASSSTTPNTTYTTQQRIAAASAVATTNSNCTALLPFYWEIGDKTGKLGSGVGGFPSQTLKAPSATTLMPIASASKWIFSTYVVEKQQGVLATSDIQRLNMTSGYVNFNTCSATSTVSSCLSEPGYTGGTNGDLNTADIGKFFYGGGHMQELANYIGLGPDNYAALATQIVSVIGSNVPITYNQPQLAGGVNLTPSGYGQFLRNMLNNKYPHMLQMLGTDAVCTNYTTCPTAIFSPINQSAPGMPNNLGNLQWHYSLGHWVEDDPTIGDGAFSSLGKGGFYPWIDATKTYYGLLTPSDPGQQTTPHGVPINCGRLMREAWITPDMTFPSMK